MRRYFLILVSFRLPDKLSTLSYSLLQFFKQECKYRKKIFEQAIEILNEREKEIITLRKLKDKPVKLEELSKKFNISRERVRQIEEKAFEKLQKQVSAITQ